MVQDIDSAAKILDANLICGASYRIVEISYKEYCILHFYGSAYNNSMNVVPVTFVLTIASTILHL